MNRRTFIGQTTAAGVLLSTGWLSSCVNSSQKRKLLILGGTNFVGPAIVNEAMRNGHNITLFNRGITNPQLFPDIRWIKGDREKGPLAYTPLQQEKWDVVIDVWPEKSILVEEAVKALADHSDHYVFISSIAVYNDFQEVGLNEVSQVVSLELNKNEWGYSEEKLSAEEAVRATFSNAHTILRPGPIKGWRDPANDLLYWCIKLTRDEAIIAPGSGSDPLQFIDVKDVGKLAIMGSENKLQGTFNCTGPVNGALLWKDFLELAKTHFNSETELVWASEEFLAENEVYSFSDLPLWAPLSEDRGFMQISNDKLKSLGFESLPIQSTLDDCLNWHLNQNTGTIKFGISGNEIGLERARELTLLKQLEF